MTAPVPTIRPATHGDLQQLAALLAPEPLFSTYDVSTEALEKRWCDALTRGESILVACPEAQPAGLCWFSPSGTFALGAYLRLIVISSSAQSQGLGAYLLAAFEAACGKPTGGGSCSPATLTPRRSASISGMAIGRSGSSRTLLSQGSPSASSGSRWHLTGT